MKLITFCSITILFLFSCKKETIITNAEPEGKDIYINSNSNTSGKTLNFFMLDGWYSELSRVHSISSSEEYYTHTVIFKNIYSNIPRDEIHISFNTNSALVGDTTLSVDSLFPLGNYTWFQTGQSASSFNNVTMTVRNLENREQFYKSELTTQPATSSITVKRIEKFDEIYNGKKTILMEVEGSVELKEEGGSAVHSFRFNGVVPLIYE